MNRPADAMSVRCYGASHGSHAHDHFQILLGLDGVLELEVDGHGRRIAAGDGVVIVPGDRHDFEASGSARCLVLDSSDARWQHAHHSPEPRTLPPPGQLPRRSLRQRPAPRPAARPGPSPGSLDTARRGAAITPRHRLGRTDHLDTGPRS